MVNSESVVIICRVQVLRKMLASPFLCIQAPITTSPIPYTSSDTRLQIRTGHKRLRSPKRLESEWQDMKVHQLIVYIRICCWNNDGGSLIV